MTVSKVTIKPHENHDNWHVVTIESRVDPIGKTSIELLCSDETIRQLYHATRRVLGIQPPKTIFDIEDGA